MSETIIVTGGSGFIGSAVCRRLLKEAVKVINCDIKTYAAAPGTNDELLKSVCYSESTVDVRDVDAFEAILYAERPRQIWHLAAETHVDRSIDGPRPFVETNVGGTAALLMAASRYWKTISRDPEFRFVHVSTDEVYGSISGEDRFTEEDAYRPSSPYSASKASSDHFVMSWYSTYGLPTLIVNCANNYGPYQFPEKLVPKTIINAINGHKIPLYGSGDNIREWIFVEDCVDAIWSVSLNGAIGSKYNIGSGINISNGDIVDQLCVLLDRLRPSDESYRDLVELVPDRPGHDYRYAIASKKMREACGWTPHHSFNDALEITARWYLENEWWWRPLLADGATMRRGLVGPGA